MIGWCRISNTSWRRGASLPLGESRREVEGRPGGARGTRPSGCWELREKVGLALGLWWEAGVRGCEAVARSRVVVEAGSYSPSFEGSPWAGGAGGLSGRWLGSGWLLSWRRVLWKAGGLFLRWWLEQGRSHPKEVALT